MSGAPLPEAPPGEGNGVSVSQHGLRCLVLVVTVVAGLITVPLTAPASAVPFPRRMAALGDSITRGFNACGWYVDCPSHSWSTGFNTKVNTHYLRLKAHNKSLTTHNNAARGAKVAALAGQANMAVSQRADYVTILIGANDVCTRSEAAMTSVADFEARFREAMGVLHDGIPDARIFVASIPDIKRLWQVGKDSGFVRLSWTLLGTCRSMLAHPRSSALEDTARRGRVRQRVIGFNAVLAAVCAEYPTCRFDGNAVFSYPFTLSQVSRRDHFHPNADGQAAIARETYRVGFWSSPVGRPDGKDRASRA